MKGKIIKGVFSLLLLLTSSATMAATIIVDFTATVLTATAGSPLPIGTVVTGHTEYDQSAIIYAWSDPQVEAEFYFGGPNTFGGAAGGGWSLPAVPGQTMRLNIENNYAVTASDLADLPSGLVIPPGFQEGDQVDVLELEVYESGFNFATGTGDSFGLLAIFLASEEVVDDDFSVDMDKLFSSAFYLGFWAQEFLAWGENGEENVYAWRTAGTANMSASAVPIPAAVWLFGSGLMLMGTSRRRKISI